MNIKPGLFIVGAAKSGTTALYYLLAQHKDIFMSPVKEPNYFADEVQEGPIRKKLKAELKAEDWRSFLKGPMTDTIHTAYIKSEKEYLSLFKNAGHHLLKGESSVSYLFATTAAKNIFHFNPDAKIIIMLRQPAERAYSHYLMERRLALTKNSFKDDLEKDRQHPDKRWGVTPLYLELSSYYEQVKRYFDVFPEKQIKVILFEDFISDQQKCLASIYNFLNLNAVPSIKALHLNESLVPRSALTGILAGQHKTKVLLRRPLELLGMKGALKSMIFKRNEEPLKEDDRQHLNGLFAPDIRKLAAFLHTDLSHWLQ